MIIVSETVTLDNTLIPQPKETFRFALLENEDNIS